MEQDLLYIIYSNGIRNSMNTIFNSVFDTKVLVFSIMECNKQLSNYTTQGELPQETKITIENGGTEFKVNDILYLYSLDDSKDCELKVINVNIDGEILDVAIENLGTGYNVNDTIFGISNKNGSSATFQVDSVNNNGGVLSVSIISDGHNYSIDEIITITPKIGTGAVYYVNSVDENGSITGLKRKYGGILYNSGTFSQTNDTIRTNNFGTGLILSVNSSDIIYDKSVTLFTTTYEMDNLNKENMKLLQKINGSAATITEYRTFISNINLIAMNWYTIIKRTIDNLSLSVANSEQEDGYNKMETNTSSTSLNTIMINSLNYKYKHIYLTKLEKIKYYANKINNVSNISYERKYWGKNSPITMFLYNDLKDYVNKMRDISYSITNICVEYERIIELENGIYNDEMNSILFKKLREDILIKCNAFINTTIELLNTLEK